MLETVFIQNQQTTAISNLENIKVPFFFVGEYVSSFDVPQIIAAAAHGSKDYNIHHPGAPHEYKFEFSKH